MAANTGNAVLNMKGDATTLFRDLADLLKSMQEAQGNPNGIFENLQGGPMSRINDLQILETLMTLIRGEIDFFVQSHGSVHAEMNREMTANAVCGEPCYNCIVLKLHMDYEECNRIFHQLLYATRDKEPDELDAGPGG